MKILSVLFFSLFLFSCYQQDSRDIVFSGKLENLTIDSFLLIDNNYEEHSIMLSESGTFDDTLDLASGHGLLLIDEKMVEVYLEPGYILNASINSTDGLFSIYYSGDGEKENNYLEDKCLQNKSFGNKVHYSYYGKLPENDFLQLMDSIYKIKVELLNSVEKELSEDFVFIEQNRIKYEKLREEALFEVSAGIAIGNKDFQVSDSYYSKLYDGIDVNNEMLVDVNDYIRFVSSYIHNQTKQTIAEDDSQDFQVLYMKILGDKVENARIKEKVAFSNKSYLSRTKELNGVYTLMKTYISNPEYLEKIENTYSKLKKVEKGAVSPSFKLPDLNGNIVELENLRGSFVYIDIWSTGCAPCISDISYLKKLEDNYTEMDITFVSINILDSEEKWKETIKEKGLKGIQLQATNLKIPFFTDYQVRGIPRYILLDREGKIIDSSAKRPYDPELKKQLDELLEV